MPVLKNFSSYPEESPNAAHDCGDASRYPDGQNNALYPDQRHGDEYCSFLKLDVKRIQYRWDDAIGDYVASNDSAKPKISDGELQTPALSVVRRFVPTRAPHVHQVEEEIHVHSTAMLKSLKIIMEHNRTINWKADPVKFDLQGLLAYMPFLRAHLRKLQDGTLYNRQEMAAHLEFLIEFLDKEYRDMLLEAESLKASAQVTFRCLWALFIPGSILLTRCPITQDICAVKLVDMREVEPFEDREVMSRHCALRCEYISIQSCRPGFSEEIVKIPEFNGARRIQDLGAYPLETVKDFINQAEDLSRRGRKHWDLACKNWCHMQYQAIAFRQERKKRIRKTFVESRVIIDQEMYDVYHPKVATPGHETDLDGNEMNSHSRLELHNEEFMLLSPRLYGLSLSDREWVIFRVDDIKEIIWDPSIFDNLQLPVQVKKTILALAKTQKEHEIHFDDFVVGKGRGLIFNLDGPPGIGKTLTAEATSEVMCSPLYTIGAGDLGTTAGDLDRVLSMISILSDRWKAVVLIDEADVFLERRTSKDIHRNAMVAVFLRQLEYYPGILFLTTNRVEVFDEAMVTRIQVSLSYRTLTADAREHLWSAFTSSGNTLTLEQRKFLREIALNGREIKNIVKVATALAAHDKHALEFKHLLQAFQVLDKVATPESKSLFLWKTFCTWSRRIYGPQSMIVVMFSLVLAKFLYTSTFKLY